MNGPDFGLFYAGDAYSTSGKIMGRQSAGKALMAGVARRWQTGDIRGVGLKRAAGQAMFTQLKAGGFEGRLTWSSLPGDAALERLGAVYYPAPVPPDMAHMRNTLGPAAYSLFGVTHTLSSEAAMDSLAGMVLAPYQTWDGLICTSTVALSVARKLQTEMREWQAEHIGATRFNSPSMSVIPLGVDAPSFVRTPEQIAEARAAFDLQEDEVAFLFAGRLVFHGKANPAVFYKALEAASQRIGRRIVNIEAGVFPNEGMANAYRAARAELAPSVRFIEVDGAVQADYDRAWKAADVFVTLSDNVQETFGLTPVEAMAAGLPVLVSDWNGYKDTVRDGIDGYRIPVVIPAADSGAGLDLAMRHALGRDNYDFFIGRLSMMTVVDPEVLLDRLVALATDAGLRQKLGAAGRARAVADFDWPVILDRYSGFARDLSELRLAAVAVRPRAPYPYRNRPDPFALFEDYPTQGLGEAWRVLPRPLEERGLEQLLALNMTNYVIDNDCLPADLIRKVHGTAVASEHTVASLLDSAGRSPQAWRALMWLMKFDLLKAIP